MLREGEKTWGQNAGLAWFDTCLTEHTAHLCPRCDVQKQDPSKSKRCFGTPSDLGSQQACPPDPTSPSTARQNLCCHAGCQGYLCWLPGWLMTSWRRTWRSSATLCAGPRSHVGSSLVPGPRTGSEGLRGEKEPGSVQGSGAQGRDRQVTHGKTHPQHSHTHTHTEAHKHTHTQTHTCTHSHTFSRITPTRTAENSSRLVPRSERLPHSLKQTFAHT